MTSNRRAFIYLAITFAISWTVVTVAWLGGARTSAEAQPANLLFTWGPPLAALVCAVLFHKGERIAVLGLRFRPSRWWLAAAAIPFAFHAYFFAITRVFPQARTGELSDIRTNAAAMLQRPVTDMPSGLGGSALILLVAAIGFSLLFTLTEELGWRGYLYRQWRQLGFWRFSVIQGLIWGLWHWPMVIFFGMVFADDRLAGLLYYPLSTMTLAPIMTLMRDRGGSIWAPGILHGTINAISIVAFGDLVNKTEPNFAALLVNASTLVFVEMFRRRWPEAPTGETLRQS